MNTKENIIISSDITGIKKYNGIKKETVNIANSVFNNKYYEEKIVDDNTNGAPGINLFNSSYQEMVSLVSNSGIGYDGLDTIVNTTAQYPRIFTGTQHVCTTANIHNGVQYVPTAVELPMQKVVESMFEGGNKLQFNEGTLNSLSYLQSLKDPNEFTSKASNGKYVFGNYITVLKRFGNAHNKELRFSFAKIGLKIQSYMNSWKCGGYGLNLAYGGGNGVEVQTATVVNNSNYFPLSTDQAAVNINFLACTMGDVSYWNYPQNAIIVPITMDEIYDGAVNSNWVVSFMEHPFVTPNFNITLGTLDVNNIYTSISGGVLIDGGKNNTKNVVFLIVDNDIIGDNITVSVGGVTVNTVTNSPWANPVVPVVITAANLWGAIETDWSLTWQRWSKHYGNEIDRQIIKEYYGKLFIKYPAFHSRNVMSTVARFQGCGLNDEHRALRQLHWIDNAHRSETITWGLDITESTQSFVDNIGQKTTTTGLQTYTIPSASSEYYVFASRHVFNGIGDDSDKSVSRIFMEAVIWSQKVCFVTDLIRQVTQKSLNIEHINPVQFNLGQSDSIIQFRDTFGAPVVSYYSKILGAGTLISHSSYSVWDNGVTAVSCQYLESTGFADLAMYSEVFEVFNAKRKIDFSKWKMNKNTATQLSSFYWQINLDNSQIGLTNNISYSDSEDGMYVMNPKNTTVGTAYINGNVVIITGGKTSLITAMATTVTYITILKGIEANNSIAFVKILVTSTEANSLKNISYLSTVISKVDSFSGLIKEKNLSSNTDELGF